MLKRMKLEDMSPLSVRKNQGFLSAKTRILTPRLWFILLVFAVPFLIICSKFLEAFERTGPLAEILALILMNVSIVSYAILIVIFKRRKI